MHRFSPILLLLLPLVWRSGLVGARFAVRDERLARFLSVGLALGGWLLMIHVAGLITRSFFGGLWIGTMLGALPGALTLRRTVPNVEPQVATSRWLWVGVVAMMALIAWPQLRYEEHDECEPFGHVGLAQTIETGNYPPRYPWFPAYEVQYHYGVDLATAAFSAVLGHTDISKTLHGMTIALWGYSFSLFWLLGETWFGGALGGASTGFVTLLAGGFQFFCRSKGPLSLLLAGDCTPAGTWIDPPFLSNFLQHPWSLGTPLGAAAILIFGRRRVNDPWWYGGLWLLLSVMSLTQLVFFGTLLGSICAAGCFEGWRLSLKNLLRFGLLFVAVVLTVSQLHGFFAHGIEPKGHHLAIQPFWTRHPFHDWLAWNSQSIGLLLPIGILGGIVIQRERLLLLLLGLGGIGFANIFSDQNALLKLTTVSEIGLGLLSSGAVVWLLRSRSLRPLGVVGLVGCTIFSLCWAVSVGDDLPGLWFCKSLMAPPSTADQQAIDYLKEWAQPGELVFRSTNAKAYALYGGLPEPALDWNASTHGFTQSLIDNRNDLLARPKVDPSAYLAQQFRWFVIGPEDAVMATNIDKWTAAGRAELRAQFPPLRVFYLKE